MKFDNWRNLKLKEGAMERRKKEMKEKYIKNIRQTKSMYFLNTGGHTYLYYQSIFK